ncbi:MAG: D-2-hydroxyacid dehydrogenase [Eubacterium sp.]|nr:D-2-hydroxyacid dehydrogenase [Eubacterium sp.]
MKAVYLEEGAVNRGDITLEPITSIMETVVYDNTTEEDKYEHIGDAEVVFSNKVVFDEETFQRLPNLKYIGVCATGYNVIDLEAANRHGVAVTNVPAYSTESVAQLAWGFILECAGKIGLHNASVRDGDWVKSETFCYWLSPITELAGKTIGIVGFGNIGSRMAEIALAFRMNVLVYTAHPDKYIKDAEELNKRSEATLRFVSLDEVWEKSDVISLHCPMTKETEKIICSDNISKMKDGVIIVNVSRGGLVAEQDLADALKSGKVSGAAVDVVSVEPMAEDNPLLTAPNICITPHMAWASVEARIRLIDVVAGNLKSYLEGGTQNRLV